MSTRPDHHHKAYVCLHVFRGESPVLLVSRPDGDWCLLCGGEHDDDASCYRVVGIGHVVERDPSISDVLDLLPGWDAERSAVGQAWRRQRIDEENA